MYILELQVVDHLVEKAVQTFTCERGRELQYWGFYGNITSCSMQEGGLIPSAILA